MDAGRVVVRAPQRQLVAGEVKNQAAILASPTDDGSSSKAIIDGCLGGPGIRGVQG